MPVFEYEIVDQTGTVNRGRQQAEDQDQLVQGLRERGQLVISVRPSDGRPATPMGQILTLSFRSARRRVPLNALVLFTGQLAAMLEAGIHLVRILTGLAREATDKHFAKIIADVRDSLAGGASFADSLAAHPRVFSKLYIAVVRAGEMSGTLAIVLSTLTTSLEKSEQLRRKVKGALTYPAVILGAAVLILTIMIVFIVPIFEDVYARADAQLPAPTRMLITVSHFVRDYVIYITLAVIAAAVGLGYATRYDRVRDVLDALKLRIPVFGELMRRAVIARTCRTLGLLLQSGIPLMEALDIATQVAGNRVIERALQLTTRGVREGGTLAEMLRQSGEFPSLVTQLVASGEESGSLATMLTKAATYYEQQVDNMVATLSSLIEPIMILVMGAIAGCIIFALYMPIFTLGQAIRGGVR